MFFYKSHPQLQWGQKVQKGFMNIFMTSIDKIVCYVWGHIIFGYKCLDFSWELVHNVCSPYFRIFIIYMAIHTVKYILLFIVRYSCVENSSAFSQKT